MNALPWYRGQMLALDVETTGVNPHTDRIVTASMVFVPAALRPQTATWWIDPGVDIPEGAAAIHGWTRAKLQAHPQVMSPGDALFQLVGRLALALNRSPNLPLVTMNGSFDLTMLEAECVRHDVPTLSSRLERGVRPVLDVFVLDKAVDPYRKGGRKLNQLAAHYGVLLGDAHQAYADALASCRILTRLAEKYAHIGKSNPHELHDLQVDWRREQMDGLRKYFDKAGKPHDGCCGSWPLHGDCCAPVAQEALL